MGQREGGIYMWWNAGGWVEMLFWAPASTDVHTADVQISNLGRGQPVAFHLESTEVCFHTLYRLV